MGEYFPMDAVEYNQALPLAGLDASPSHQAPTLCAVCRYLQSHRGLVIAPEAMLQSTIAIAGSDHMGARALGLMAMWKHRGRKLADLIILDSNPLENIRHTTH